MEKTFDDEEYFFTCLFRSPSQYCNQFSDFCKNHGTLLNNLSYHRT